METPGHDGGLVIGSDHLGDEVLQSGGKLSKSRLHLALQGDKVADRHEEFLGLVRRLFFGRFFFGQPLGHLLGLVIRGDFSLCFGRLGLGRRGVFRCYLGLRTDRLGLRGGLGLRSGRAFLSGIWFDLCREFRSLFQGVGHRECGLGRNGHGSSFGPRCISQVDLCYGGGELQFSVVSFFSGDF
jgi:hypothetical protein